jgi:lactoylglutathione lyase
VAHSVSLVITIDVADLAVAVDFYERALGLHVTRRLGPDIAELGGAETPVYLTQHAAGTAPFAGAAAPRDYRRHWTPVHLDFVVPALEPALERAVAAGARRDGAIREFAWGRFAVLADPFGNGFCILQFVGEGYAALAGA